MLFRSELSASIPDIEEVPGPLSDEEKALIEMLENEDVYKRQGQKYVSKADEIRQVEAYLKSQGVERLELVVSSSIGADLDVYKRQFLLGRACPKPC